MTCIHEPLAPSPSGLSCAACGYSWQAPYFLRTVICKWNQAGEEMERKLEAKRLKKEAKAQKAVDIGDAGVLPVVSISPSVAACFTDDLPAVDPAFSNGYWRCTKCRDGKEKYYGYPNNWKWKREKSYREHKCVG